jgi:Fe-S-cluster containining protein
MDEARAEMVKDVHETFDDLMKKAIGVAFRSGLFIPCARGCFFCCYDPAFVCGQEAELLLQTVLRKPQEEQERVKAAVKDWVARFVKAGFKSIKAMDVHTYRSAKLACPFLNNGECTVYEDRPIACRGHVAVGDREQCEDDAKRPEQRFLLSDNMAAIVLGGIAQHEDLEFDHLGLWMNDLLFGERIESASRTGLVVKDRLKADNAG